MASKLALLVQKLQVLLLIFMITLRKNRTMQQANELINKLISLGNDKEREAVAYFFKTGKGGYAETDTFLGIKVPVVRATVKQYLKALTPSDVAILVKSDYHEIRLAGLIAWVEMYKKSKDEATQNEIVELYLNHTSYVNNWDLVDLSCEYILGEYLLDRPKDLLFELASSANMWEQRISIITTLTFIRKGSFTTTLELAEIFLNHQHDLMHKATGWCLREVGKRNLDILRTFLNKHAAAMPRTMLRYSIEKMDDAERKHYMGIKRSKS